MELPLTPRFNIVAVVALAVVDTDGSTAPITAIAFTFTIQESRHSLFRDMPKVGDEAHMEVLHTSFVEMLKPRAGKLLALMTEIHGAFRDLTTVPF